jgi:hypothetical protein
MPMLGKLKQNSIFRGVLTLALFGILFTATAYARPLDGLFDGDAPPPGYLPPSFFNPPAAAAPVVVAPRAWRSSMLSERALTRRQAGLEIRGVIPVITDAFESADIINSHIEDDIVDSLISEARRRARAISFSYKYHASDDIVSIVISANVVTTLPHTLVRSVNFCKDSGRILSMNEAAGKTIAPLAERILAEKIRSNPERYYAALSAPLSTQAFYITSDRLVILFDGFRLSTRVGEVAGIEIILSNIKTVVLNPEDYRTDGPYGIKMIPLRSMLEYRLGYNVSWDEVYRRATISRNGINLIELGEDTNEYIILGTQRRALEAPPKMIGDYMYVPITFFDQILPLTTYTIGFDGSITFLAYFAAA